MRGIEFVDGEYYHLYGRGVHKKDIFVDDRDFARFLFLVLYGQSPQAVQNVGRCVTSFIKKGTFNVQEKTLSRVLQTRHVEVVAFALMPNHFHLLVSQTREGGIPSYMHKVLMGYAKYFNERNSTSGHVFEGPFKAVPVVDNNQLLHASAYIHRNPRELPGWKNHEHRYPWSSYQDYVDENRWESLLNNDIILGQFKNKREVAQFIKTSSAKARKASIDEYL